MTATDVGSEVRDAAAEALRAVFRPPNALTFQNEQVTLDAANFAFQAIAKVDKASRLSAGLFKLWTPTPVRTWSGVPKLFVKAVLAATKNPATYQQSPIGVTIAVSHRRNLQHHLDDPETFPCPAFR